MTTHGYVLMRDDVPLPDTFVVKVRGDSPRSGWAYASALEAALASLGCELCHVSAPRARNTSKHLGGDVVNCTTLRGPRPLALPRYTTRGEGAK